MQTLLQMRLAANRMLERPGDAAHASVQDLAKSGHETLGQLRQIFFKADDLAQVDAVLAGLDAYAVAVDQAHARLLERAALGATADQLDTMLASLYRNQTNRAADAQVRLGDAAAWETRQLSLGALLAGLVALGVGVILAMLTARWLSGSIRIISAAMQQMAQGDFEVTLAGADRHNELGQIARALDVFGANGRMMRDTGERRELDAARAAETAALREALQHDVEVVVAHALEGDFSQRLGGSYGMAELDALAANINALVDTVARGLGDTGVVLAALARADLTQRMHGTYQGAFARLQADTNALAEGLAATMGRLRQSSGALRRATDEILSGANDLSARTSRQIAAIEATSTAIATLSRDIGANKEMAEQVAANTLNSSELARAGGAVMQRVTAAMAGITTSSGKISAITRLIEGIAFQTNLLALNASVEAARAGDAGKGFAVVAVEVRRLAQSAAQASADIKALVAQSAEAVGSGSRLVDEAAQTLAAIREAVDADSSRMQDIAVSSRVQAAAVTTVYAAMQQMDQVAQDNAALVEETNAAIEQTQAQASALDGIVGVYATPDIAPTRQPLAGAA
jgi:methyl-accepting chemotaxis protein